MRFSLPILASALVLWGYEENATHFHPNGMKSEVFKFRLQPNPATGKLDTVRWGEAAEWRENGHLASRLNYKAEKLDGVALNFYETGEVGIRCHHRSVKTDGCVYIRQDGTIRERMVAGIERDTFITYDSLGNAEKRCVWMQWNEHGGAYQNPYSNPHFRRILGAASGALSCLSV